jgi:hypothetical protein
VISSGRVPEGLWLSPRWEGGDRVPIMVEPDGEVVETTSELEVRAKLEDEPASAAHSILCLDDQARSLVSFARILAESVNGLVVLCESGHEAARLVSDFRLLLVDMAAAERLDAGVSWLREHSGAFQEGTAFVVLTQYEAALEFTEDLASLPGFRAVVMKSDALQVKQNRILSEYGARRLVEGYIEEFSPSDNSYGLLIPSWSTETVVSVSSALVDPLLLSHGGRAVIGEGAHGYVVVGQGNIWAIDSMAVDFVPHSAEGRLPMLDSQLLIGGHGDNSRGA